MHCPKEDIAFAGYAVSGASSKWSSTLNVSICNTVHVVTLQFLPSSYRPTVHFIVSTPLNYAQQLLDGLYWKRPGGQVNKTVRTWRSANWMYQLSINTLHRRCWNYQRSIDSPSYQSTVYILRFHYRNIVATLIRGKWGLKIDQLLPAENVPGS